MPPTASPLVSWVKNSSILFLQDEFSPGVYLVGPVDIAHPVALGVKGDPAGQAGKGLQLLVQVVGELVRLGGSGLLDGLCQHPEAVARKNGPYGAGRGVVLLLVGL